MRGPPGSPPSGVVALVDEMFEDTERYGTTYAVAIVQGGPSAARAVRRGAARTSTGPPEPVAPTTPLLSWSMAKSVLHAAVGVLVGEGRLVLDAPPGVPSWTDEEQHAFVGAATPTSPRIADIRPNPSIAIIETIGVRRNGGPGTLDDLIERNRRSRRDDMNRVEHLQNGVVRHLPPAVHHLAWFTVFRKTLLLPATRGPL